MKIPVSIILLFFIMLIPVCATCQTLTVATGEWAPYVSSEMENKGFITQILTRVFEVMNAKAEYVFYPWRRCYDSVATGKVWAAFPYSYTEERAKKVYYSDKLSYSITRFFVYKNQKIKKYNTPEDLHQYRVGGVLGYFYESAFNRLNIDVDYVSSEGAALEKLVMGRTQLLPLNELVGWYLIGEKFPDKRNDFRVLEKPYSTDDLHLIVSRNYPGSEKLLEQFNQALRYVKDVYIYNSILERYKMK